MFVCDCVLYIYFNVFRSDTWWVIMIIHPCEHHGLA